MTAALLSRAQEQRSALLFSEAAARRKAAALNDFEPEQSGQS